MNESKFVIVGGGMVAGYAAKQLVELGLTVGRIGHTVRRYFRTLRTAAFIQGLSGRPGHRRKHPDQFGGLLP